MSSRCAVDLSPRSRSACSNRRMRARTDMGGRLARAAAPALEQPAERGRQVVGLEVAPRELVDQDLDAVARREVAVEEDDVLAVEPAPAAVHVVADLAEEHLLPDLDAEAAGELLQLLAEGLVTAAHGASLTDASAFASAALGLRGREGGWYMPRRRAHDQEHPGRAGRVGARQRRSPVRPLAGGALARDGHGAARDRHRLDRGLVLPRRVGLARLRAVPRFLLQDARGAAGARPRAAR